jgi:transketolase
VNSDRSVTLENHTVVGGLFETVASAAVRRGSPSRSRRSASRRVRRRALPTLHDRYGLSTARIVATVLAQL